jgi:hypothetical protein
MGEILGNIVVVVFAFLCLGGMWPTMCIVNKIKEWRGKADLYDRLSKYYSPKDERVVYVGWGGKLGKWRAKAHLYDGWVEDGKIEDCYVKAKEWEEAGG